MILLFCSLSVVFGGIYNILYFAIILWQQPWGTGIESYMSMFLSSNPILLARFIIFQCRHFARKNNHWLFHLPDFSTTLGRSPKWKDVMTLCFGSDSIWCVIDPCFKYITLNSSNQYKHTPTTFFGIYNTMICPSSYCQHTDAFPSPMVKPCTIWKQKAQENSLRRFVDMVPQAAFMTRYMECDWFMASDDVIQQVHIKSREFPFLFVPERVALYW